MFTATVWIRTTPNHVPDLCQPGKQAVCQACQVMRQVGHCCKVLGNEGQGAASELFHLHQQEESAVCAHGADASGDQLTCYSQGTTQKLQ